MCIRDRISTTLEPTDSTVEVHFTINEIPHVVRRNAKSGELTLKVGYADFVKAREADVRELLPIQAYSQKQLSSVSVRIDELTRFVTSPIRRQLAAMDQEMCIRDRIGPRCQDVINRRPALESMNYVLETSWSPEQAASALAIS